MDKIVTLDTDIQSDAIPACVCEKSLADKVEKGCLRCGYGLGTVAPTVGLIGSVAVNAWKAAELVTAKKLAAEAGAAAGLKAGDALGMKIVTEGLRTLGVEDVCPEIFKSILKISHYSKVKDFAGAIFEKKSQACSAGNLSRANRAMCETFDIEFGLMDAVTHSPIGAPGKGRIVQKINELAEGATQAAETEAARVTATEKLAIETAQKGAIEAASMQLYTTIAYSILAILII
ncbi:surface antigen, partial [Plasmodium falciparum UGT5.1]